MKTYNIISPNIDGILSDDFLYFEGVKRPSAIYTIRDGEIPSTRNVDILEKYFNDIYNLLLRKLSSFVAVDDVDDQEAAKMQALLQEMIKVKSLIGGTTEDQV